MSDFIKKPDELTMFTPIPPEPKKEEAPRGNHKYCRMMAAKARKAGKKKKR